MNRIKGIIIGSLVIIFASLMVVLLGSKSGVMENTSNEYGSDIGYFDEERKYVSDMRLSFSMETADTYIENIEIEPKSKRKIYIVNNELTDNSIIVIKDSKNKEVYKKQLKEGQKSICLGDKEYEAGKYKFEISLPKKCRGTLEIKVDE